MTERLPEYIPEFVDDCYKEVNTHVGLVDVELCENPRRLSYEPSRPLYYINTHVFVICYAVDDRSSFLSVRERWMAEREQYAPNTPIVLVACKIDLRTKDVDETKFISKREGKAEAKTIGAKFFETSALGGKYSIIVISHAVRVALLSRTTGGQPRQKAACVTF